MIRNSQNTVMIRDYVESIYRHRGKLLLYNLAIAALAVAVMLLWPREYRSESKLWLKIGRENSRLDPTASTGKTIAIQENDREDEIKSVLDIIASRGVIEGAVDLLGPKVVLGDEPLPGAEDEEPETSFAKTIKGALGSAIDLVKEIDPITDREEAVQEIIKHMGVSAERKSNVVSLKYDTSSPELAQAVVQSLIDQYKATHARVHTTTGSRRFFSEQLDQLKERVAQAAEDLRIAKDEIGLASVDGHRRMLEVQMEDVGKGRLSASSALAEAKARAEELQRQLKSQPAQIQSAERSVPNTGRDSIRDQLYTLQVQRMELESTMNAGNPKLEAIKKQEAEARRTLAEQTTKARSEITRSINVIHRDLALELAQVRSNVSGLQATLDELNQQEEKVRTKIANLNRQDSKIRQRKRDMELAESNYMSYAESLEDARMDEALNDSAFSNISVAQAPTLEEKPISPAKSIVAILGLAAMLFGSLAIAAGALLADNSVSRQKDVAELVQSPLIISIPNRRSYRNVLN